MKTLILTFNTTGNRTYTMSIENPKEDLTLDTVKASADKLVKVLENRSGVPLTGLAKAEFVTETREALE